MKPKINVSELLKQSWTFMMQNIGLLLLLACIGQILGIIATLVCGSDTHGYKFFIMMTIGFLFNMWFYTASIIAIDKIKSAQTIKLAQLIGSPLKVYWPLLISLVLLMAMMMFGLMLLVIPGICVMVYFGLCNFPITLDNVGPLATFKRISSLVLGNFWGVFFVFFVLVIVDLICSWAGSLICKNVGGEILVMLAMPFFTVLEYTTYKELVRINHAAS